MVTKINCAGAIAGALSVSRAARGVAYVPWKMWAINKGSENAMIFNTSDAETKVVVFLRKLDSISALS